MVNTRKSSKSAVPSKASAEGVKDLSANPKIVKSKKATVSKAPSNKSIMEEDLRADVSNQGLSNPKSTSTEQMLSQPTKEQEMEKSQTPVSTEGVPAPISKVSTIPKASKVDSVPKDSLETGVVGSVSVNVDVGAPSRGEEAVETSLKTSPVKKKTKSSGISKIWREKILASGYVKPPSSIRRKVVVKSKESPRKFAARITAIRGHKVVMSDSETEHFYETVKERKVILENESEEDQSEKSGDEIAEAQPKVRMDSEMVADQEVDTANKSRLRVQPEVQTDEHESRGDETVPIEKVPTPVSEHPAEEPSSKSKDTVPEKGDQASIDGITNSRPEKDDSLSDVFKDIDEIVEALQQEEGVNPSVVTKAQSEGQVVSDATTKTVSNHDEMDAESEHSQDSVPLSVLKKGKAKKKVSFDSPIQSRKEEGSKAPGGAESSRKRKREVPVPVSAAPGDGTPPAPDSEDAPSGIVKDGVWFVDKVAARKWKSVLNRKIIPEKLLDEKKYSGKEVVHILKQSGLFWTLTQCKPFNEQLVREAITNLPPQFGVIGDKDFGKVFVRGRKVEISPELINIYFSMDDPLEDKEEADYDRIADTLTAGTRSWWEESAIPVAELTTFYSMLFFIAIANWMPSSHRSSVNKEMGQLLYQIGNKLVFNLGRKMFSQIAEHATSSRSLHQIMFPSLIYELIIYAAPELKSSSDRLSKGPQKFVVDHKLFKGKHVNDLKTKWARKSERPESSRRQGRVGAKLPPDAKGKILEELEFMLGIIKEQRSRINALVRSLRYPSDDEDEAMDDEATDSDDSSSA